MELRPPGSPVDDPLFAAVRRRHPDVDLVVLPPAEPETEPESAVDDATVARTVELVAETAGRIWSAVAPLSDQQPEARLRFAERESEVRAVARVVEKRSDGYALLVRLRHEMEERGWSVQRPPGPEVALERLAAERDGGRLTASYAETSGAVLVELSSAPLPVGTDRARGLVG